MRTEEASQVRTQEGREGARRDIKYVRSSVWLARCGPSAQSDEIPQASATICPMAPLSPVPPLCQMPNLSFVQLLNRMPPLSPSAASQSHAAPEPQCCPSTPHPSVALQSDAAPQSNAALQRSATSQSDVAPQSDASPHASVAFQSDAVCQSNAAPQSDTAPQLSVAPHHINKK